MSTNSDRAILQVNDLTIEYRRRRTVEQVLSQVNLSIPVGQTVGLVGESGSGKTTLARAVLGQVPVTDGTITFDGQDITHPSKPARRALSQRIQVVFQNPYQSFNPQRTVAQSVAETLATSTDISRDEVRTRVLDALEHVGIDRSAADRYPGSFSGGQRQRIAIARALLPRPDLVICDEAVSALDLSVQAQVINLLIELQDELGLAYLFITHDLSVVRHLCHQVVVLRHGTVVEYGPTDLICAAPQEEYTRLLLDSAPIADPKLQAEARARRASASV